MAEKKGKKLNQLTVNEIRLVDKKLNEDVEKLIRNGNGAH